MGITKDELEDYLDSLIDVVNSIDPAKITLLTGRNGGGKSLVRKLLHSVLCKKLGREKVTIPHASQELRTGSYPEMGAFSSLTRDLEWLATSSNTVHTIKNVLKQRGDYFVIDEPEIGLGEELQLGLAEWLNNKLKELSKGSLIICHSRLLAKEIKHDVFINLEGMSYEEWINRSPKKISIEEFENFNSDFFTIVKKRLREK